MKAIICDVCKNRITEPLTPGRDLFFFTDIDICESCRDELELSIKKTMRAKKPFDYGWYKELLIQKLEEGIEKDKIVLEGKR